MPQEELEYHVHAHLDVFIDGSRQPVPADIGIDRLRGTISPLHTHDATGIIHIESAQAQTFTLGQFFTEWGVRLDAGCVGDYCRPDKQLAVYLNGEPYSGDPAALQLTSHAEIAVVIGSPPARIPSGYGFPEGY